MSKICASIFLLFFSIFVQAVGENDFFNNLQSKIAGFVAQDRKENPLSEDVINFHKKLCDYLADQAAQKSNIMISNIHRLAEEAQLQALAQEDDSGYEFVQNIKGDFEV